MRIAVIDSAQEIVTNGLLLNLDAAQLRSYPGTGTNWQDLSGNGNNLTIFGSPSFITSNGGYFSFSANTQYANRASPISTSVFDVSMCAWIRPSNLNQSGMAVHNGRETGSAGDGFSFGLGNGGGGTGAKLTVIYNGKGFFDSGYTFPTANTWYYVVYTKSDSSNQVTRMYVNGVQTPNTSTVNPNPASSAFTVGQLDRASNGLFPFAGGVAVVQFYNRNLTVTEVLQNFNADRSRFGL